MMMMIWMLTIVHHDHHEYFCNHQGVITMITIQGVIVMMKIMITWMIIMITFVHHDHHHGVIIIIIMITFIMIMIITRA